MFIAWAPSLNSSSEGAKCYVAPTELWILGAVRAINIALLTELETVSNDNPTKLMYKGKTEQIFASSTTQTCRRNPSRFESENAKSHLLLK